MARVETSIQVDAGLVARLERLIPALASDPRVTASGRVTRADVMRRALVEGVEVLEHLYHVADHEGREAA